MDVGINKILKTYRWDQIHQSPRQSGSQIIESSPQVKSVPDRRKGFWVVTLRRTDVVRAEENSYELKQKLCISFP